MSGSKLTGGFLRALHERFLKCPGLGMALTFEYTVFPKEEPFGGLLG
jgi:hypothetical protein